MSIIIRLQNLPLSANSLDIRKYFAGLSIPDGGVHIIGGEKGDAFIAFSSDDDARQAMAKDGGKIKDAAIKLFLSSRNEMQQVITQARSGIAAVPANVPAISTYKPLSVPTSQQPASNFAPQTSYASNVMRPVVGNEGHNRQRDRSRSPLRVGPSNGHQMQNQSIQGLSAVRPALQTPMGGLAPVIKTDALDVRARLGGYLDDSSNGRQGGQLQLDEGSRGQWSRRPPDFNNPGGMFDDRILSQPTGTVFDQRSLIANNTNNMDMAGNSREPVKSFSGRVEMRGLPFNVTTRDIQDFFRLGCGMLIPDDSVRILVDERGFTTGGATIRMASEQDLISAVGLSGRLIQNQTINITPMPVDLNPDLGRLNEQMAMNNFIPNTPNIPNTTVNPPSSAHPQRDLVVYMKGIPFNACTEKDVSNFFIGLKIEQVVFEMDRRTGKPAGNAYVEFKSKEDYERALEMNLKHMGRRYIEVFPTTRDDMEEARSLASGSGNKETFCINISGLPPSVTNADLTSYFKEAGAVPFAIHIMLKPNGTNAGEAFIEFADRENQTRALSRHGDIINGYRITIKETPFVYMQRIVGRPENPPGPVFVDHRTRGFDGRGRGFRGRGFGRGRGGRFNDREGSGERSSPASRKDSSFGSDSRCVVHASNVPYKATNDDLATFFADFAVIPGSIERKLNERGMATPEARIAFKNAFEAEKAAKSMHKKHLLGRPVFLRIA